MNDAEDVPDANADRATNVDGASDADRGAEADGATNVADDPAVGPAHREIDLESLKGLAHPLRVQILEVLSTYGAFTASGLAERLGESSGATSYHLRQLQRHGFIREVDGRGTGRERWWERVPGGISLSGRQLAQTPAGRSASSLVLRQWEQTRAELLRDFSDHAWDKLPEEWTEVSELSTMNLRLTKEQLGELTSAFAEFQNSVIEKYRGLDAPGARPVQIHFNAFPVLDGEETPEP